MAILPDIPVASAPAPVVEDVGGGAAVASVSKALNTAATAVDKSTVEAAKADALAEEEADKLVRNRFLADLTDTSLSFATEKKSPIDRAMREGAAIDQAEANNPGGVDPDIQRVALYQKWVRKFPDQAESLAEVFKQNVGAGVIQTLKEEERAKEAEAKAVYEEERKQLTTIAEEYGIRPPYPDNEVLASKLTESGAMDSWSRDQAAIKDAERISRDNDTNQEVKYAAQVKAAPANVATAVTTIKQAFDNIDEDNPEESSRMWGAVKAGVLGKVMTAMAYIPSDQRAAFLAPLQTLMDTGDQLADGKISLTEARLAGQRISNENRAIDLANKKREQQEGPKALTAEERIKRRGALLKDLNQATTVLGNLRLSPEQQQAAQKDIAGIFADLDRLRDGGAGVDVPVNQENAERVGTAGAGVTLVSVENGNVDAVKATGDWMNRVVSSGQPGSEEAGNKMLLFADDPAFAQQARKMPQAMYPFVEGAASLTRKSVTRAVNDLENTLVPIFAANALVEGNVMDYVVVDTSRVEDGIVSFKASPDINKVLQGVTDPETGRKDPRSVKVVRARVDQAIAQANAKYGPTISKSIRRVTHLTGNTDYRKGWMVIGTTLVQRGIKSLSADIPNGSVLTTPDGSQFTVGEDNG